MFWLCNGCVIGLLGLWFVLVCSCMSSCGIGICIGYILL